MNFASLAQLRIISIIFGLLIVLMSFVMVYSYHVAIHQGNNGGWNAFRFTEIGLQLGPFFLLAFSILATALFSLPKALSYVLYSIFFLSGFLCLLTGVFATLHALSGLILLLLIALAIISHLTWLTRARAAAKI